MDKLSPNQITQMIEMLQSMLEQASSTDEVKTKEAVDTGEEFVVKKKQKDSAKQNPFSKKKKKKFVNSFDDMNEFQMHKEDVEIDKKLQKFPVTSRSRKYVPVTAQCRICGKQEKINPAFMHEGRYKCNNCSQGAG
jgi:hypothetical protein